VFVLVCLITVGVDRRIKNGGVPGKQPGMSLVLASASPRRKQLLTSVGLDFRVRPANIDESRQPGEAPLDYVRRMAREKAGAIAEILESSGKHGDLPPAVLAADTIVCRDDRLFGKPVDEDDAIEMWRHLSGRTHEVYTALTLCYRDRLYEEISASRVSFKRISEAGMRTYWASGEPMDKAGGYAIQGLGSAWVGRIEGSHSGIVGLPMFELNRLLANIGVNWL
jgi:septum formation protein